MVTLEDFSSYLTHIWSSFEEGGVSIVLIRKSDKAVVGVALNQDFFTIADTTKANGALFHLVEFFQEVKGYLLLVIFQAKNSFPFMHSTIKDRLYCTI
jgi:hypothetical protein